MRTKSLALSGYFSDVAFRFFAIQKNYCQCRHEFDPNRFITCDKFHVFCNRSAPTGQTGKAGLSALQLAAEELIGGRESVSTIILLEMDALVKVK